MERKELSWKERGRLWFRLSIRGIVGVIVALLIIKFGKTVISLFMPFILALLLAMAINPLILKIQSRVKFRRSKITIFILVIIFTLSLTVLWILLSTIATEVIGLLNGWEELFNGFQQSIQNLEAITQELLLKINSDIEIPDHGIIDSLTSTIFEYLKVAVSDFSSLTAFARDRVVGITSFGVSVLIFAMGCYFITTDYPTICNNLANRLGVNLTELLNQVKAITIAAFGGYIKSRAIVAAGVGFIIFVGFILIGQEYALLLALIMAVLDFIPIIGSGTLLVPWSIIDLLTGNITQGLQLLAIYGVVTVYRNIAEPKVVGDKTGLSPTLSLITIYIGMRVAGVVGMILGPVLTIVIINSLKIGVLRDTRDDLQMAVMDILSILNNK